MGFFGISHATR